MANGSFSGNPKTEWLGDQGGRFMRLIETFWYLDPHGRRWDAPAGCVTDGATIPRTLWSSLGSPFTGNYRLASILHDSALQNPAIVRIDADNMFYFACLAGGCTLQESKLFYAGVRLGSWATVARDFVGDLLPFDVPLARLPGQQTPSELEVRAKYTLLASELMVTGDRFDAVRAAVDRHLGSPPPD
jgi:hypothetical protein